MAQLCGSSVSTAARRGQELLANGIVRVGVVPDPNHNGPADRFFLRIGCGSRWLEVAKRLTAREDIRFLALVTGQCDIIAELCVRKSDSLHTRIIEELLEVEGVTRCETDLTLHTYKVGHDWSRQLLSDDGRYTAADPPHQCEPGHFDDVDRQIIARLRDDGRAGSRETAEAIGYDESTVRRRFDKLRSRGCIDVVTLVPAAALGFESEIWLTVTVQPSKLDAVARKLTTYRGVRFLAATLNGSSLVCELILPSSQEVFEFLTQTLAKLQGVQGWIAGMELITFKRGFIPTPWSTKLLEAAES